MCVPGTCRALFWLQFAIAGRGNEVRKLQLPYFLPPFIHPTIGPYKPEVMLMMQRGGKTLGVPPPLSTHTRRSSFHNPRVALCCSSLSCGPDGKR